jgi:hypothetical protein
MRKIKLTLSKANKIKVELSKFITQEASKKLQEVKHEFIFGKDDSLRPREEIKDDLDKLIQSTKAQFDFQMKEIKDFHKAFFSVKSSIFAANQACGLSDVMIKISEVELLTKAINEYKVSVDSSYSTIVGPDNLDTYTKQIVSTVSSFRPENSGHHFTKGDVQPLSKKDIDQILKDLKREKDKLIDEKTRLNNVTEIEVEIEDGVIEYLGL